MADFEGLSQYLQKRYGYADYVAPVLVGYSSGATLIYASLLQGPPNTFRGGISLGFCPDLPLTKPMCRGNGLKFSTTFVMVITGLREPNQGVPRSGNKTAVQTGVVSQIIY